VTCGFTFTSASYKPDPLFIGISQLEIFAPKIKLAATPRALGQLCSKKRICYLNKFGK